MRRVVSHELGLILLLLLTTALSSNAEARSLDRVVAVAGGHIILLSEVQARAKPYVTIAARQEKDVLALARLTSKALRETCERLIDELLIEDEAANVHLVVGDDEVDKAIALVATDNNLTLTALFAEAENQGYAPGAYRDEIKHTLLEWKLVQVRMANAGTSGHSDEQAMQAARKAMVTELRANVYIEDRLAP